MSLTKQRRQRFWRGMQLASRAMALLAVLCFAIVYLPLAQGSFSIAVEALSWSLFPAANLTGFLYLYHYGSSRRGRWRKLFLPLIGIAILALLCKLQHWGFANLLITGVSVAIAIAYVVRTIAKRTPGTLDFLKLGFVLWYCTSVALTIMHVDGMYHALWPQFLTLLWIQVMVAMQARRSGANRPSEGMVSYPGIRT